MNKTVALAALVAASFAAPITTITPAAAAEAYPAKCLVLPLLQADCRDVWRDSWDAGVDGEAVVVTTASTSTDKAIAWPVPAWWNCAVAPEGSGHMFDCE